MLVALLLLFSCFKVSLYVQMFLPHGAIDWFVVYGWGTFLSISFVFFSFSTAGAILRLMVIETNFQI